MLWHDNFFTLLNGQTKPFFGVGNSNESLIIQHPYLHFGSLRNPYFWINEKTADLEDSTPIYLNQYEVAPEQEVFDFHDFLSKVETNWHLEPDERLWFETGFWSVIIENSSYMGMSIERLRETLIGTPESKFGLCLSNNDSIIIVSSGKRKNETVLLSIYASNETQPFAEIVDPFRKSVDTYCSATLLKDEMLREEDLRRFWFAKRPIKLDPVAYVIDREHGEYKLLPILENIFKRSRDPVICKIDYFTGITSGGFIESEYSSNKLWQLYADIWNLGSLSIVEFNFSFWKRDF